MRWMMKTIRYNAPYVLFRGIVLWQQRSGREIQASLDDGSLSELLPHSPAIYSWRLDLSFPTFDPVQAIEIYNNVMKIVDLPKGRTSPKFLSHSLKIQEVTIVGKRFDVEKQKTLKQFLSNPANAHWFLSYFSSLSSQIPNLYTGNTVNLCDRIKSHVGGGSDFGRYILDEWPGSFSNLSLHWKEIPNGSKDLLEMLEFLNQSLTVSGLTKRAG